MLSLHQAAIDADFTELIDQHSPALARRFAFQQVQDRGGFADTEKSGDDIRGHRVYRVGAGDHGCAICLGEG